MVHERGKEGKDEGGGFSASKHRVGGADQREGSQRGQNLWLLQSQFPGAMEKHGPRAKEQTKGDKAAFAQEAEVIAVGKMIVTKLWVRVDRRNGFAPSGGANTRHGMFRGDVKCVAILIT